MIIGVVVIAAIAMMFIPGMNPLNLMAGRNSDTKVSLCHRTGSISKNPFVVITVSQSALPAHLAHFDKQISTGRKAFTKEMCLSQPPISGCPNEGAPCYSEDCKAAGTVVCLFDGKEGCVTPCETVLPDGTIICVALDECTLPPPGSSSSSSSSGPSV